MYDIPQFIPQGWQCPVCKRVYAPGDPFCTFCGQETYVTNVTNPEKKDETILKISDIYPGYMPDNTITEGQEWNDWKYHVDAIKSVPSVPAVPLDKLCEWLAG